MKGVPGPETRLLVVEDNRSLRIGMARALAERFDVVDVEDRGDAALARLRDTGVEPYDVIVTDLRMPGADGLAVLRAAQARELAHRGDPGDGLRDDRRRGRGHEARRLRLRREAVPARRARRPRREGARPRAPGRRGGDAAGASAPRSRRVEQIVGGSPTLAAAIELAQRVAPMRSTVLLTGETGTGKELVAGLIHESSTRADGPFVKVNCAALPETLLESELFGHEKGAFTSADRVRIGRFEQANGGTLFLDEVGDLSLATQAKLLRALQDQQFQRLGGTRVLRTDARIVAATNRDLERAIASGDFREDLYFRLNVITIPLAAAARAERTTSSRSRSTSWSSSATSSAACGAASRRRRGRGCSAIRGRATCASCATRSSAPCCCPRARASRRTTCGSARRRTRSRASGGRRCPRPASPWTTSNARW